MNELVPMVTDGETTKRPRFDPTINLGNIAVVFTLLVIIGGSWLSNVTNLQFNDKKQDERLDNQATSILQMRENDNETARTLLKIAVDIERIKTIIEKSGTMLNTRLNNGG